ncbi:Gamma-tubulin complex component 3, partial [Conglomerata obtusa]
MKNKIIKLITEYKILVQNDTPISDKFVNYCLNYTQYKEGYPLSECKIKNLIKHKTLEVQNIYKQINKPNDNENKLIYILLCLTDLRKKIREKIDTNTTEHKVCEYISYLKKGALGFKIGIFDDFTMYKIKEHIDMHVYDVLFQIYQNANIYKKLKSNKKFFTRAQMNFNDIIEDNIKIYEQCVINQSLENGILGFYLGMWNCYLDLQYINQLNECFKENCKNPYKNLKSITFENMEIMKYCTKHLNEFANDYINTGNFHDTFNEFFIVKKSQTDPWAAYCIDYGLIPYFLNIEIVTQILYIGKCVYLINKSQIFTTDYKIDLFDKNLSKKLNQIILNTNIKINELLLNRKLIDDNLKTIKSIFLFRRSDFTETLSFYLKDYNRLENKEMLNRSISYILEKSLLTTFGSIDELMSKLDVCILDNEAHWNYISLYCQLEFPINLIFTREIILKLVAIFKFLWRFKKIENLLKQLKKKEFDTRSKIRILEYNNLIQKFYFYFFEEVIENEFKLHLNLNGMIVEDLRKKINNNLDIISQKLFQSVDNQKNEIDYFLNSLEILLMSLGKMNVFTINDEDVRISLNLF